MLGAGHLEDGVVGADAHVADRQQAEGLDEPITPLVAASLRQAGQGRRDFQSWGRFRQAYLDDQGEDGEGGSLAEEGGLGPGEGDGGQQRQDGQRLVQPGRAWQDDNIR